MVSSINISAYDANKYPWSVHISRDLVTFPLTVFRTAVTQDLLPFLKTDVHTSCQIHCPRFRPLGP